MSYLQINKINTFIRFKGYNIPLNQEVISDYIYTIRKHLKSRGSQFEFKIAIEVVLWNEELKKFVLCLVFESQGVKVYGTEKE
jgi:hypothetical protein